VIFPYYERSTVIVNHHPQGAGGRLSRTHEYYILVSDTKSPQYFGEPLERYQEERNFMRSGTASNNFRSGRWNSFYALLYDPRTKSIIDVEDPVPLGEKYPLGNTAEGYQRIYPINSKGEERVWRSSYKTGRLRAKNNELYLTKNGAVNQSIDHDCKRETLFSNWTDSKFNAGTYGSTLLDEMGLGGKFDYPKSINTIETGLWAQTYGRDNGYILDYFAGSGTTGHAVINLNRKYGGCRKYILVEMGEYFNLATKPRVLKAIYSDTWKEGVPVTRQTSVPQIVKYMRLESYEDALSNVKLSKPQGVLEFDDDYLIHYMMDVESKESLLNFKKFNEPFNFMMRITEKNESKQRPIDMVETFNYLIGLTVISKSTISTFSTEKAAQPAYEGAVELRRDAKGDYSFQQLEGTLPDGRRALVIWRNVTSRILESNAALDAYFLKHRLNPQDREFDVIYVNGDNNLQNLRLKDETWKVVMTEQEFNQRMWEE
jgi:adenine-specific DNA-methyltransferase